MQKGEWRTFEVNTDNAPMVFDTYNYKSAREHWTNPVEEGRRLYVGGLSDVCDQGFVNAKMRELFNDFQLQAVSKRILPAHRNMDIPASGQCYCFVDLPSADEASRAMSVLNGKPTPYGGAYKIEIAHNQENLKECREQGHLLGQNGVRELPERDLQSNWRLKT